VIASHADYKAYLEADRISLNRQRTLANWMFDDIWRFQRTLRKLEYLTNCKKNTLFRNLVKLVFIRQSVRLGFSIPINVFGPGLCIAHYGTIVVNGAARIGANCCLHACVNIGTTAGKTHDAPTVGDNCYIGPGAKLFGKITIGSDMVIGANAVVTKSFPDGSATLGGVPAKIISHNTSRGLLIKGHPGTCGTSEQS